jgi:hypothetical protein
MRTESTSAGSLVADPATGTCLSIRFGKNPMDNPFRLEISLDVIVGFVRQATRPA